MDYHDLIAVFGGDTEAGRAVGLERQSVHAWKRTGKVPLQWQIEFEKATDGKLKAAISKENRRVLAKPGMTA